mmetsp:Transcript_10877/g.28591  ORF Transcript_10877/g.28591 Transcript_10877/m.28591 type:complete len:412 (-) Transcript_10877:1678-2913(-)
MSHSIPTSPSPNDASIIPIAWPFGSKIPIITHNPSGRFRVLVTKPLVGDTWLNLLTTVYHCRVDQVTSTTALTAAQLKSLFLPKVDAVVGQLTEPWTPDLFAALAAAGGVAYSNVAVGYDNVDVAGATRVGIAVGNTPGVLTEATAEMAVSLVMACARRVVEADAFMRQGKYELWLPNLFIGKLLSGKTVGVIGAGRIGSTAAIMLARGFRMDVMYYDKYPSKKLEDTIRSFSEHLVANGEKGVSITRVGTPEEILEQCDVVSLHPNLDKSTHHLINKDRLALMKRDAILVNCARGPIVNEVDLVQHCRENPEFFAGLDVFEDEPLMKPGLKDLDNVVIVPHIASATFWTRSGMSILAAANVGAILHKDPVWASPDVSKFLDVPAESIPRAAPSIVNRKELNLNTTPTSKL